MQLTEVKAELEKFAKHVIKQARTNLSKRKKNSSKKLYNSLGYNINANEERVNVIFQMEDYGKFQDEGVSGTKTKYKTPYKYKSKMPPTKAFSQWVVRKGLKGVRDEKGKFIARKSLQYLIARSVFLHGIKPSMFFTRPFNQAFDKLEPELQDKFGIDIENSIIDFE
tara:strand:+ start:80 stop:580 length:501 start_codon:yes stop_codon:yes gene_type:complete